MTTENEIRTGRHCVFALHVHLVFVTKYRKRVFTSEALDILKDVMQKVCNDFDVELAAFEGEDNHVHLLINYPPQIQLSKLVNSLKGVSSRMLRKQMPSIANRYYKDVLWSPSYFAASCGGAPLSVIKQYVEQQDRPL
ncbi:MAG: IS200/IS605 family transposase [Polaromonas sp.]